MLCRQGKRNFGEKLGAELLDVVTGMLAPMHTTYTPPVHVYRRAVSEWGLHPTVIYSSTGYAALKAYNSAHILPTHSHTHTHMCTGGPKMRKWYGQESNSVPRDGGEQQPDQQVCASYTQHSN